MQLLQTILFFDFGIRHATPLARVRCTAAVVTVAMWLAGAW